MFNTLSNQFLTSLQTLFPNGISREMLSLSLTPPNVLRQFAPIFHLDASTGQSRIQGLDDKLTSSTALGSLPQALPMVSQAGNSSTQSSFMINDILENEVRRLRSQLPANVFNALKVSVGTQTSSEDFKESLKLSELEIERSPMLDSSKPTINEHKTISLTQSMLQKLREDDLSNSQNFNKKKRSRSSIKDENSLDTESLSLLTNKKKKSRTTFSGRQIYELEKQFEMKKYLSSAERAEMASILSVTETQVKIWFQNRRTKWKKQENISTVAAQKYRQLVDKGLSRSPQVDMGSDISERDIPMTADDTGDDGDSQAETDQDMDNQSEKHFECNKDIHLMLRSDTEVADTINNYTSGDELPMI